jgi:hypothetical protein
LADKFGIEPGLLRYSAEVSLLFLRSFFDRASVFLRQVFGNPSTGFDIPSTGLRKLYPFSPEYLRPGFGGLRRVSKKSRTNTEE